MIEEVSAVEGQAEFDGMPPAPRVGRPKLQPAVVRARVALLGLPYAAAARLCGVPERRFLRWTADVQAPAEIGDALDSLEGYSKLVRDGIRAMADQHGKVYVYRTDREMWKHQAQMKPMPATWWSSLVGSVLIERPGLKVEFWPGTSTKLDGEQKEKK